MDEERFDELARQLRRAATRRAALTALLAGLAGGGAAAAAGQPACRDGVSPARATSRAARD